MSEDFFKKVGHLILQSLNSFILIFAKIINPPINCLKLSFVVKIKPLYYIIGINKCKYNYNILKKYKDCNIK